MQTYLVGGAVRDELLGRPVHERDWVVVGATPDAMLSLGYRQVGRNFPVFLHPETGEEYALARTERKTGAGHTGFAVDANPTVTLEQDLARRDLRINAMARMPDGVLVDPFGGRDDLQGRVLRHVGPAFTEDPLRVFRVARFAAQLDFSVASETLRLMRSMAARGDLDELAAERVWREFEKALSADWPRRFLGVLEDADALAPWFQELVGGVNVRSEPSAPAARFATLGLSLTAQALVSLCGRLKAPRTFRDGALRVAEHGAVLQRWPSTPPDALLAAITAAGLLRPGTDPDTLCAALACRGADVAGLRDLIEALGRVNADAVDGGLEGPALGRAIAAKREALVARVQAAARTR